MKTVVITGGAKRLGHALVKHYASQGWRVLFTCRHSAEEGALLAEQLGTNVEGFRCSVADRQTAALIRNWLGSKTNSIDLLICNASSYKKRLALETQQHDFDDLVESNFAGPFFLAQQCHDLLTAAKGCIVNIADAQVAAGLPGFSAYIAAKAGLVSITKSLALEWAPDIRVNAVLPGTMPWPEATFSAIEQEVMIERIPAGRTGEWLDLIQAVDYLQRSEYSTGCSLTVDGGRSIIY